MPMKNAIRIADPGADRPPGFAQRRPSGGGDSAGSASNKTPPPVTGEQVYQQVCQACHMADAKGGKGAAAFRRWRKIPSWRSPAIPSA